MDYKKLSDEQLVSLAKNGENLAINELIARYELNIEIKAGKFSTHHWIKDDLIQIGRIAVSNAINKYDPNHESKSKFATYVNICLENEFKSAMTKINKINSENVGTDILDFIDNDKNSFMVDARFNPEEIAIKNETEEELKAISVKILSNIEQNVYNLKKLGYKNGDISAELKIDKKSVENALTRIKQKFYKELKENREK
jgi:RNA polymerase sporulation-specific sigma factor